MIYKTLIGAVDFPIIVTFTKNLALQIFCAITNVIMTLENGVSY
jgi:hypothetical protein